MPAKTKTQRIAELEERIAELERERQRLVGIEEDRDRAVQALKDSEQHYQALFNNSVDLVYIHDFEGNFIDANDRALDLLGYDRTEIRSINFARLINKEDLPRAMGTNLEVLKLKASSKPQEFMLRTKVGRRIWVETSGVRLDEKGLPRAVLAIGRDVTDRKNAEAALRESESRFRSMFNNAAEMIYVYDRSGHFLDANERTVSSLGYFTTELLGMKLQDLVLEDDIPIILEDICKVLDGGSLTEPSEYRIRAKNGRILWVEVNGIRLSWGGGMSVILGAARDITRSREETET